jgi:hypothetical protein
VPKVPDAQVVPPLLEPEDLRIEQAARGPAEPRLELQTGPVPFRGADHSTALPGPLEDLQALGVIVGVHHQPELHVFEQRDSSL